jgi:6-pyruvoyltetrahydropterin/6-carboxytetrahydropterin synthase
MVYDFGLTKQLIKDVVDSFDHSVSLWSRDNPAYLLAIREHSSRWVTIPVSPSAEQLSRVLFVLIDRIISQTNMINGEENVKLNSIIVHETDTGYAQCFEEDAYNSEMGDIDIEAIQFSKGVQEEWSDRFLHEKLINKIMFTNPKNV